MQHRARGHRRTGLVTAFVVVAVFSQACTNETANEDGITLRSSVIELVREDGEGLEVPLEGVEVCVFAEDGTQDPCTTSDADGRFVLRGVPANSDVMLSLEKEGKVPALQLFSTRDADLELTRAEATILVDETLRDDATEDFEQDPNFGAIGFFGATPQGSGIGGSVEFLADYTAHLDPPQGDPLYVNESGEADRTLEASTAGGVGGFQNVEPGYYTLTFSHPELECTGNISGAGWREGDGTVDCEQSERKCGRVRLRVVPGWVTTQIGVLCQ